MLHKRVTTENHSNSASERTVALKKVKELCKEFGFTAGMPKGSRADGRQM